MLFFYTITRRLKMKRASIAVLLLGLVRLAPLAQQPQVPVGASIAGIVIRVGSNEPLPGAQAILTAVTPNSSSGVPSPVVTGSSNSLPASDVISSVTANVAGVHRIAPVNTDRDGRFVFQNLEPGLYSLEVFRNEYSRQAYGQRVAGGPAAGIRLASGQALTDIVMALTPAGNVAGVIRSLDGHPQNGVPIQLLRATFNSNGQRTFHVEGTARTNDRGEYRLYWITPGRYYISAGTAPGPNRPLNPNGGPASPNEIPDQSFALTYFPGVLDANTAATVEVLPAADVNGIDFVAARQQLYSVRGRLVDSGTGRPPAAASVSLAYKTLMGASGAFNAGAKYDASTGDFELRNVPPGAYVLQAIASGAAPVAAGEAVVKISALALQPNARLPIEVANSDVNGVNLQLVSGISLPGRISIDGNALSQMPGWEKVQVQLKPTFDSSFAPNLQPAQPIAQRPKADGTFSIEGVSPGEFMVGPVTGLPSGFYVKEARFNQEDVLSKPLRLYASSGGALEIVLSSKAGNVSGTTVDAQMRGAPGTQVVLIPERQRQRTDLYRTATSDANGKFAFRSIPPGDYRVFGWEVLESYAYFDQELLHRVESQGVPVHVSESEGTNVTVRIIPAGR
jgi:hypothetical protein